MMYAEGWVGVYMMNELIGQVHTDCMGNVPDEDDGNEIIVDAIPLEAFDPADDFCVYHND
jgi:hypothetical protein